MLHLEARRSFTSHKDYQSQAATEETPDRGLHLKLCPRGTASVIAGNMYCPDPLVSGPCLPLSFLSDNRLLGGGSAGVRAARREEEPRLEALVGGGPAASGEEGSSAAFKIPITASGGDTARVLWALSPAVSFHLLSDFIPGSAGAATASHKHPPPGFKS